MTVRDVLCKAILAFISTACLAKTGSESIFRQPFYAGVTIGYGSTTWSGLVPSKENQNEAMNTYIPIDSTEGGRIWGLLAGYELTPFFAVEVNYMNYPDATVTFDEFSLYSFEHDGLTSFDTNTQTYNFMGKVMLIVPNTHMRVYSSAGAAIIMRDDVLLKDWQWSPSFGAGLNYHFTDRFMGELSANYTAGFGESKLDPASTYFPFLYSISFKLAYCFGAL